LILLDREGWIGDKRRATTPQSCASRTADEVIAAVHGALTTAGSRHTVVRAQLPLATHGAHGGFFSWREHLFPLVRWKSWLWVPIPILSSGYVGVRKWGGYAQDLGGSQYQEMITRLSQAYQDNPPLFHAGGHDHALQVLQGSLNAQWHLVSGAGTVKRPDEVGKGNDTIFVSPEAGYLRVDLLRDGRVRLGVTEVTRKNVVTRPLSMWLLKDPTHDMAP
jgi:hypothetical protein